MDDLFEGLASKITSGRKLARPPNFPKSVSEMRGHCENGPQHGLHEQFGDQQHSYSQARPYSQHANRSGATITSMRVASAEHMRARNIPITSYSRGSSRVASQRSSGKANRVKPIFAMSETNFNPTPMSYLPDFGAQPVELVTRGQPRGVKKAASTSVMQLRKSSW